MKKNSMVSEVAGYLLFCAAVVAAVLAVFCHTGCKITGSGITVIGASESPEITSVKVLDAKSLQVQFNKEVSVKTALLSELEKDQTASLDRLCEDARSAQAVSDGDGKTVIYVFSEETQIGKRYQLFSEIADSRGNTLTFALPFEGFNARLPVIVLAEIGSPQGNKTSQKVVVAKRCEYIMLRALSSGNLGGLELFSAQYPLLSKYRFPPVEVKTGEFITVHLRTYEGQNYTEELGENLSEDTNEGSRSTIRDLYFVNSEKCAAEKYDAIILRNRADMEILDSVFYTVESEKEKYGKFSETVNLVLECNKWQGSYQDCAPVLLERSLTTTGVCLQRNNSDDLLSAVQRGELSQKDIVSSKEDWSTALPIYSDKRKW